MLGEEVYEFPYVVCWGDKSRFKESYLSHLNPCFVLLPLCFLIKESCFPKMMSFRKFLCCGLEIRKLKNRIVKSLVKGSA